MHNLRRYYYQNKFKIWRNILIIASIILVIQLINYIFSQRNKSEINNSLANNTVNTQKTNTTEDSHLSSNTSVVTGNSIDNKKIETDSTIIDNFVKACNNNEIETAYNLLTEECKEVLYPTIQDFQSKYYNNIFENKKKIATIENWHNNTYKISFKEDIMATGNISNQSIQDYITVIEKDDEKKLNINSLIEVRKTEKVSTENNITMKIISKAIYMEYEEYKINIVNQTENTILLDTLEDTKSIYIQDNNEMKYYSYSHEILSGLLKINSMSTKQLTIKFAKRYSSTRDIQSLVFSNFILNYNEYLNGNTESQKFVINL